jgi:hypothetical protein
VTVHGDRAGRRSNGACRRGLRAFSVGDTWDVDRVGFAQRKPYAVPEDLDDLVGPVGGTVTLPASMAWTGRTTYDLDDPADVAVLYERVLVESDTPQTVALLVNHRVLRACWRALFLPDPVRRAWEQRFTELATAA